MNARLVGVLVVAFASLMGAPRDAQAVRQNWEVQYQCDTYNIIVAGETTYYKTCYTTVIETSEFDNWHGIWESTMPFGGGGGSNPTPPLITFEVPGYEDTVTTANARKIWTSQLGCGDEPATRAGLVQVAATTYNYEMEVGTTVTLFMGGYQERFIKTHSAASGGNNFSSISSCASIF